MVPSDPAIAISLGSLIISVISAALAASSLIYKRRDRRVDKHEKRLEALEAKRRAAHNEELERHKHIRALLKTLRESTERAELTSAVSEARLCAPIPRPVRHRFRAINKHADKDTPLVVTFPILDKIDHEDRFNLEAAYYSNRRSPLPSLTRPLPQDIPPEWRPKLVEVVVSRLSHRYATAEAPRNFFDEMAELTAFGITVGASVHGIAEFIADRIDAGWKISRYQLQELLARTRRCRPDRTAVSSGRNPDGDYQARNYLTALSRSTPTTRVTVLTAVCRDIVSASSSLHNNLTIQTRDQLVCSFARHLYENGTFEHLGEVSIDQYAWHDGPARAIALMTSALAALIGADCVGDGECLAAINQGLRTVLRSFGLSRVRPLTDSVAAHELTEGIRALAENLGSEDLRETLIEAVQPLVAAQS